MKCRHCGHDVYDHPTLTMGYGQRPIYTGCDGNGRRSLYFRCNCSGFEPDLRINAHEENDVS